MKHKSSIRITIARLRAAFPVFHSTPHKTAARSNSRNTHLDVPRWSTLGKVTLAVVTVVISAVGLMLTNADSHLAIFARGPWEFRGSKDDGQNLIVKNVLHATFTNYGLHSDYIDRIDIHPVELDETIKSEVLFIDRQIIHWRERKELRFEVLITNSMHNRDQRDLLVTFYDSKGRQVAQVPIATRIEFVHNIQPYIGFETRGEAASGGAKPPGNTPVTLSAAHVSIVFNTTAVANAERLFYADISSSSGNVVARSGPSGRSASKGNIDLQLSLLTPISRQEPLRCSIWAEPPTTAVFHGLMTWSLEWSDGYRSQYEFKTPDMSANRPKCHEVAASS